MSSSKPCPYAALGVPKDADPGAIKTAYRKLALKCHPDKLIGITDEAVKKEKEDEFHKIHSAYELIGDEESRAKHDAEVKLDQLRKEALARNGSNGKVEVKTARYETRTAAPGGATFSAKGPSRYEERRPPYDERKPSRSHEEDRYFTERAHKKYDAYESAPRATRTARPEKEPLRTKVSSDRSRSERVKTRDRDERRERSGKFVIIEDDTSSSDDKARYESDYRRRTEDERRKRDEEDIKRSAAEARRKAEDRRSHEEVREPRRHRSNESELDRQRKTSDMVIDAVRYMSAASRSSSSRDVRHDDRSSRRPEQVRRSSARPSSGRDRERSDRKFPDIVEWDDDRSERRSERAVPPPFKHSSSSPADIHITPRATPQRSQTEIFPEPRRVDTSPPATFRRAETMPTVPSSSSYRKETTVPRPSGLRSSESYVSAREPEYATVPPARTPPSSTKKYYYTTNNGGVTLLPEQVDVANGRYTVLREPGPSHSHRHRSPSPLSRPPIGSNRPSEPIRTASSNTMPPPPLGRTTTYTEDRGRTGKFYGEVDRKREDARRQTSFSPDNISYTRKIGPDDIRWSATRPRDDRERDYAKPTLGRHPTYVY